MKLNLQKEDFRNTPARIVRVWKEFLEGYDVDYKINYIVQSKFPTTNNQIVIVKGVETESLCPHHFLPVHMNVWLGYIPKKYALGLSKIIEMISLLSHQPVLQENLTDLIADTFMEKIKPKGVIVFTGKAYADILRIQKIRRNLAVVTGGARSVHQKHCKVVTSSVRGIFETDNSAKTEFLSLIALR